MNTQLRMKSLRDEAGRIYRDPALTVAAKSARLDGIEAELKSLSAQAHVNSVADMLRGAGGSAFGQSGLDESSGFDPAQAVAGSSPSLLLTPDMQQTLFKSVQDRQGITVKVPVSSANVDPATFPMQFLPPVLAAREPTRILDLLPSSGTAASIVEYYITTGTAAAAATGEGTLKPQSSLALTKATATVTKIAHFVEVTEEAMSDFAPFTGLLSQDMVAGVIDAENRELLSASGTAPHGFKGLLVVSGTQSYTQAASPETALDAIAKGADGLRAGGRFVMPDGIVMHPVDYGDARRIKDSAGRYVADGMSFGTQSPLTAAADSPRLWNLPVILTSEIPEKTVIVGNFARAAMSWIRESVTVRVDPYSQMTSNLVNIIAEERLALGVVAPTALSVVTLL